MNNTQVAKRVYTPFTALQACVDIVIGSKDLQDVSRRTVHSNLFSGVTLGAWVYKIENGLSLIEVAGYGKPFEDGLNVIPMWDENILSKSIQSQNYVFEKARTVSGNSLGAIPILVDGLPIGCFVLVMSAETIESPANLDVFMPFGALIGSLLTKGQGAKKAEATSASNPADLTSRQVIILGHMSDGLTNLEISTKVLLSESTVRQETIRIYRALGVGNRTEAVALARKLNLIPSII